MAAALRPRGFRPGRTSLRFIGPLVLAEHRGHPQRSWFVRLSVEFVRFVRPDRVRTRIAWTRLTLSDTAPARKIYLKEGFPCRARTGYMLSSQRLTALKDLTHGDSDGPESR